MISKLKLPFTILLFSSLFTCCTGERKESDNTLPNIILILADDMGYGDISALNPESKIKTPELDQLVAGGRNFTEAHTSAALCTPTRYALLTGRYSFRTGLNGVETGYSPPMIEYDRETIASLLKKAGYQTAIIGKWHLGLDWQPKDPTKPIFSKNQWIPEDLNVDYTQPARGANEIGFDYAYISPAGNNLAPFTFVRNGRVTSLPTDWVDPQIQGHNYNTRRNGGDIAPGYQFDQALRIITAESKAFIKQQEKDQPFFLYYPLTAPHFPWDPHPDFVGTSNAGEYGDFVQEIDARVGEIVNTLKETDQLDNTLIIFTADNGGAAEPFFNKFNHEMNYGRRGQKSQIWEGGVRVPFIAHWPAKIPAGSFTDQPISLVDMLATFAAITNTPFESRYAEDSYDVSSVLLGTAGSEISRGPMINQAGRAAALSIIKDGWKLIPYGYGDSGLAPVPDGAPAQQLYNLQEDSLERYNLYQEYPQVAKDLFSLLEKYKSQGYSRENY